MSTPTPWIISVDYEYDDHDNITSAAVRYADGRFEVVEGPEAYRAIQDQLYRQITGDSA